MKITSYFLFQATGATRLFSFKNQKLKLVTLFIFCIRIQTFDTKQRVYKICEKKNGFIMNFTTKIILNFSTLHTDIEMINRIIHFDSIILGLKSSQFSICQSSR